MNFGFVTLASFKTTLTRRALCFDWLLAHQYDVISARASNCLYGANPGEIQTKQQQHPGAGGCGEKWPALLELDHTFEQFQ